MNIIYFSDSLLPSVKANSIHVMKMSRSFAKLGNIVTLIAKKNTKQKLDLYNYYNVEKVFRIKLLPFLNVKFFGHFFYLIKALFVINNTKPDFVYSRYLYGSILAILMGYNVVFEAHQNISQERLNRNWFFKKLITNSRFNQLIVISDALKSIYTHQYPQLRKIVVAHDGADINKFISESNGNDALKIGYFGSLYKGRGIEIIMELAQSNKDCEFHIYGGSNEEIKKILKMKQSENLCFHGFKQQLEVDKQRAEMDILLAPYQENVYTNINNNVDTSTYMSPLKIFEYMAAKKPIIASDLPVIREVLNDKNSILVPPNDVEKWQEAIHKLKDVKLRHQLGVQAYKDFIENYTWDLRANKILNSIHEI